MTPAAQPREGGAEPPSPTDAFAAEVEDTVAALHGSVDKAGLRRDAYGAVIEAQARMLALQPGFLRRMETLADRGQGIDPAALERLERAAVTGAARQARELAQAHAWRTILIASAIYAVSLAAVAITAVQWGHAAERVALRETEQYLKDAFAAGPASAQAWALLMANNDAAAALTHCRGNDTWRDPNTGRQVCRLYVYTEGPKLDARQ